MSQTTGPGGVQPPGAPDQTGATTGDQTSAEKDKQPTDDEGETKPTAD